MSEQPVYYEQTTDPVVSTSPGEPMDGAGASYDGEPVEGLVTPSPGGYWEQLVAIFRQYDLAALADEVLRLAQEGWDGPGLTLKLQETDVYKERFAGNEERKKKGLKALSPAEYLAVEEGYRQAFGSYNMDARYSEKGYLDGLIARDVSPVEVVERIQWAGAAATTADPNFKRMLGEYYGVGQDELVNYFLDESIGTEILRKQSLAAEIGSVAAGERLRLQAIEAERLADAGITKQQMAAALGDVDAGAERAIAARFGSNQNDEDVVRSELGIDSTASAARRRLHNQEKGLFRGSGSTQTGQRSGQY